MLTILFSGKLSNSLILLPCISDVERTLPELINKTKHLLHICKYTTFYIDSTLKKKSFFVNATHIIICIYVTLKFFKEYSQEYGLVYIFVMDILNSSIVNL